MTDRPRDRIREARSRDAAGDVPRLRGDEGFSLVELMVVILIIGILIAVALPVYLGARTRAQDSATKSDLRSGLIAGVSFYTASQSYTGFDASAAALEEPNVAWIDGGAPVTGQISVAVHTTTDLLLVRKSASGTFFCVAQVLTAPATARGKGATFASVDTVAECTNGW